MSIPLPRSVGESNDAVATIPLVAGTDSGAAIIAVLTTAIIAVAGGGR